MKNTRQIQNSVPYCWWLQRGAHLADASLVQSVGVVVAEAVLWLRDEVVGGAVLGEQLEAGPAGAAEAAGTAKEKKVIQSDVGWFGSRVIVLVILE